MVTPSKVSRDSVPTCGAEVNLCCWSSEATRVRERLFCCTVSAQLTLAEQRNDWEALTERTEHNWSREGEDVLAMGRR